MEQSIGIAILLFFVYAIVAILSIILFCKVWGMTNNVKAIRKLLEQQASMQCLCTDNTEALPPISIGDLVVNIKTEEQMRVESINDNTYTCTKSGMPVGTFHRNEIELFDTFYKK